jgi:hypothetical protein
MSGRGGDSDLLSSRLPVRTGLSPPGHKDTKEHDHASRRSGWLGEALRLRVLVANDLFMALLGKVP